MADDQTVTLLLRDLDAIANAPMTASQREMRAAPLLAESAVSVDDLTRALHRRSLGWNREKAEYASLPPEIWMRALRVVARPNCCTLRDLLELIHQAEAAASMLKAGYIAGRDAHGRLVWSR